MKKLNCLFLVLFANTAIMSAYATASFEQKVESLIQEHLPNATMGLVIQDPNTGKMIIEKRSHDNFYPASNTKLFTAAAALKFFGTNFQFQTSLHAPLNKIKDGILGDNLYIVFRGDPSLTTADLTSLIKQFKAKGINQIKGNVIIDDKSFEDPPYAPGWTWDSIRWSYSAPVTSIILNENKVRLKLEQPHSIYEEIKVEQADESIPPLKIESKIIAVSQEESEHSCQLNVKVEDNNIRLNGCWPIDKTPSNLELALDAPKLLAKQVITQALAENEIKLTGKIEFRKAPKEVPAILIKRSLALKSLLRQVLAESNNLYSESLTKALGLAFLGQGSFQVGIHAIQGILTKDTQMDFSRMRLSDGSGQSRYNLVSPFLISQLLYHLYQDPHFPVFYASLSTSGKNGSLIDRMKNKNMQGKIVAKTGTAIGTSALSGYFTANSGKQYLFSLLINQSLHNNVARKSFEDKLCRLMLEEPWLQTAKAEKQAQPSQPIHRNESGKPISTVPSVPM